MKILLIDEIAAGIHHEKLIIDDFKNVILSSVSMPFFQSIEINENKCLAFFVWATTMNDIT